MRILNRENERERERERENASERMKERERERRKAEKIHRLIIVKGGSLKRRLATIFIV